MKLRAVLFDLDETLHDKSATLIRFGTLQHHDAQLATLGMQLQSWLARYIDLNNQRIEKIEVFAKLASEFAIPSTLQNRLLSDFDANLGYFAVPCGGAIDLLTWCKSAGLKIGVVTNGRDAFQRSKIAGMGIGGLIDVTLTSGSYGVKKPELAIFRACLEALGTASEVSAFVGDNFVADMKPAIELGMKAVWKSRDRSDKVAFSSFELSEILSYFRKAHC